MYLYCNKTRVEPLPITKDPHTLPILKWKYLLLFHIDASVTRNVRSLNYALEKKSTTLSCLKGYMVVLVGILQLYANIIIHRLYLVFLNP